MIILWYTKTENTWCTRLKRNPSTADIYVIIISASAQKNDLEAGKVVGADEYFIKPFSPVALVNKIQEVEQTRLHQRTPPRFQEFSVARVAYGWNWWPQGDPVTYLSDTILMQSFFSHRLITVFKMQLCIGVWIQCFLFNLPFYIKSVHAPINTLS